MKVKNNANFVTAINPHKHDDLFITYIREDEIPIYKEAIAKFGENIVKIQYYPQIKGFALIYTTHYAHVDLTRFWEIYENIESERRNGGKRKC